MVGLAHRTIVETETVAVVKAGKVGAGSGVEDAWRHRACLGRDRECGR